MILCGLVEPACVGIQKNCHLVDESSRSAGACAVHPLLNCRPVERYLCVLAAKLYGYIGLRNELFNGSAAGYYFLLKSDAQKIRKRKPAGSRNNRSDGYITQLISHLLQEFSGLLEYVRHVSLVLRINDLIRLVKQNEFNCC